MCSSDLDQLILAAGKEFVERVKKRAGLRQLLVELELQLLHALAEEDPDVDFVEKDALKEDGATHQAFTVSPEDFELAAKKMKDWGVKVYDIPTVERPSGRGFYFFDPDGNLLQLYAPPKTPSAS